MKQLDSIFQGANQCTSECRNAQDGPYCVSQCPITKYKDERNVCQSCHENCDSAGCTGPRNTIGEGACNSCYLTLSVDRKNISECLPQDAECPAGFYKQLQSHQTGTVMQDPLGHQV